MKTLSFKTNSQRNLQPKTKSLEHITHKKINELGLESGNTLDGNNLTQSERVEFVSITKLRNDQEKRYLKAESRIIKKLNEIQSKRDSTPDNLFTTVIDKQFKNEKNKYNKLYQKLISKSRTTRLTNERKLNDFLAKLYNSPQLTKYLEMASSLKDKIATLNIMILSDNYSSLGKFEIEQDLISYSEALMVCEKQVFRTSNSHYLIQFINGSKLNIENMKKRLERIKHGIFYVDGSYYVLGGQIKTIRKQCDDVSFPVKHTILN